MAISPESRPFLSIPEQFLHLPSPKNTLSEEIIEKVLKIPFVFEHGPDVVRNLETARRIGVNCEALYHLLYHELFNEHLPSWMRARELLDNTTSFRPVDLKERPRALDLWVFRRITNNSSGNRLHLGAYAKQDTSGNHLLIHAGRIEGHTTLWPVQRFPEHYKLLKIQRFNGVLPIEKIENVR